MIEKDKAQLSRRRQCALLGASRSGLYHRPGSPSTEDLEAMRALDGQYLKTPFHGTRRMAAALRGQGLQVGREADGGDGQGYLLAHMPTGTTTAGYNINGFREINPDPDIHLKIRPKVVRKSPATSIPFYLLIVCRWLTALMQYV